MQTSPPIRLAIADDHPTFRKGLALLLTQAPGIELMMEATDGQDLIEKMETTQPEVILMDISMPRMGGIEATQYVREHWPEVKVIILSMHDDDSFVTHLVELGANGYLVKDSESDEIIRAVQTVATEDYYYGPFLTKVMHRKLVDKTKKKPIAAVNGPIKLSDREIEVLRLICEGLTTAQIAERIFLSDRTVEGHRTRIMEKIGAKNTAGMVVYAVKNGLY
jgi:DNA-binding NarL/FixJ family response regulator